MSDIYLEHYGKKGMKWGVRKSKKRAPLNKNYSKTDRDSDDWDFGQRGKRRISARLDSGKTLAEARRPEIIRKNIPRAAIAAAGLAYSSYVAFGVAMETPQGKAAIRSGVQFVGNHAKSKTSQAAVMKGARFLDNVYGLK